MEEKKKISRKEFLRLGGSVVAGGAIAGVAGNLLWKMYHRPDELFYSVEEDPYEITDGDHSLSPYRMVHSIPAGGTLLAFERDGEELLLATPGKVTVTSLEGRRKRSFPSGEDIRDLAVWQGEYYLLYPSRIAVFGADGTPLRSWNACSDDADYCFFTVFEGGVYVSDARARNICQYRHDGTLLRFIESPRGFVVPSYSFAIANSGGLLYCSNPGRHQVECYSAEGKFLYAFGEAGTEPGRFSGCCNPVHISFTPEGELLTSEKGLPRISCWSREGELRSVLLNRKALGGGHDAREVRMLEDGRLLVAGEETLLIFQYDARLARADGKGRYSSACELCGIDCPVRRGVTI